MAQNLNERHAPHYAVGEREGSTLMYIDLENCDLLQWLRDAKERAQL